MVKNKLSSLFETFNNVSNVTQKGNIEYWYARDIMPILGYEHWENFEKVLKRAIESCKTSKFIVSDHFLEIKKMAKTGSDAQREVKDYQLTRYACYLIAQNGDPKKEETAFAQNYFAVQMRKREVIEKRLALLKLSQARATFTEPETALSTTIYERGVDDMGFGRIRSKGDQALFGGLSTKALKQKLGVKGNRQPADSLHTLTIAAQNLATEMTNYNVEHNDLYGEADITKEHVENNTAVRSILTSRNIYPENLPVVITGQSGLVSPGLSRYSGNKK